MSKPNRRQTFPYVGKRNKEETTAEVQLHEQTQEQQIASTDKEKDLIKSDEHLHPFLGARIWTAKDLPTIDDWSKYGPYGQKNFYITYPRLPSMEATPRTRMKFRCRRFYRIITFDGVISGAYVSAIKNEYVILWAIGTGLISAAYKSYNPDHPLTVSEEHAKAIYISTNFLTIIVVFAMLGIARKLYSLTCIFRTDEQDAQRALFNKYEAEFKDDMPIFNTRSWRFDSAGDADAREVAQAVWSKEYNEMTTYFGMQWVGQFFLWENERKRAEIFDVNPPPEKTA